MPRILVGGDSIYSTVSLL